MPFSSRHEEISLGIAILLFLAMVVILISGQSRYLSGINYESARTSPRELREKAFFTSVCRFDRYRNGFL